jgi:hypothetical protein
MKKLGDPKMVLYVRLGYDFDDLYGSYSRICEEKFWKTVQNKMSFLWNSKTVEYFWEMFEEVFGESPDFMIS